MTIDPKRIVEEERTGALAAMLCAARADGLTQEQIERVRGGLAASAIAASAGAAAKQTGLLGASLSTKVGLALAVVTVAMGGAWLVVKERAQAAAPPPASSVQAQPRVPLATALASVPSPLADPPVGSSVAELKENQAAAPPAPRLPLQPSPAPSIRPTPGPGPSATSASPSSAIPADEGALLLEARGVLDSDPARALELVRQHEEQFPNSQLAPERARIKAEATKRGLR